MDLDINNSPLRRQLRAEGAAAERSRLKPLLERCARELERNCNFGWADDVTDELLDDLRAELDR